MTWDRDWTKEQTEAFIARLTATLAGPGLSRLGREKLEAAIDGAEDYLQFLENIEALKRGEAPVSSDRDPFSGLGLGTDRGGDLVGPIGQNSRSLGRTNL